MATPDLSSPAATAATAATERPRLRPVKASRSAGARPLAPHGRRPLLITAADGELTHSDIQSSTASSTRLPRCHCASAGPWRNSGWAHVVVPMSAGLLGHR